MSDAADSVDRAARAMGKVNGPEPSKISWFFWQVIYGAGCNFVCDDGRWIERNAGLEADEKPRPKGLSYRMGRMGRMIE
jgi:hypothetical protein